MDTWTLVLTVTPVVLVLIAWITWLLFNLIIVKWHGLEGLKSTPGVAQAFRPRDWAVLIPRFRQDPAGPPGIPAEASETGIEPPEGGSG